MHVGMIGLGRMGGNMGRRLLRGGHTVVAHDVNAGAIEAATADSLEQRTYGLLRNPSATGAAA